MRLLPNSKTKLRLHHEVGFRPPTLYRSHLQRTGYGNRQRNIRVHFNNGQHRRAVFARCRHQGLKALKQLCWPRHIAVCAIIYKCNIVENANVPVTLNKVWQAKASARQPPDLVNLTTQQTPNNGLAPPLDASIATLSTSSVKSSNHLLQNHSSPSTLSRKAKVDKMAKNSKTMIA